MRLTEMDFSDRLVKPEFDEEKKTMSFVAKILDKFRD